MAVRDEALSLRELLKFEFLFSGRAQFEKELADEVRLIGPVEDTSKAAAAADVRGLLKSADLLLAHLVLRPFLDAYHIVADRLAALEDESLDENAFLAECLEVGKQWELQRRIASAESQVDGVVQDRAAAGPPSRAGRRRRNRRTSPSGGRSSRTRSRPRPDASTRSPNWPGHSDSRRALTSEAAAAPAVAGESGLQWWTCR